MAWRIEIPYDTHSPYLCGDSHEAADLICGSDEYQGNYEIDDYAFDDYLNSCYDRVDICGCDYDPAEALKSVNESLYYEMKREQESYEASENQEGVRQELDGGEDERGGVWFYGNIRAYYIEDEENDDDEGHDVEEFDELLAI